MLRVVESAIIETERGYDELVKRIPCRVVRSVPFNGVGGELRAGGSGDGGSEGLSAGPANVGFENSGDSGGWIFGPSAVKARFAETYEGFALDFLA